VNGELKEYPRIAGVSSFGAGGSNAHLIVEEYLPSPEARSALSAVLQSGTHLIVEEYAMPEIEPRESKGAVVLVFSARNQKRLEEQVRQMTKYLETEEELELLDLAYTLLVGREALDVRLALIVSSIKELKDKLIKINDGQLGIEGVYTGEVKRNKEVLDVFKEDNELQEIASQWIKIGEIEKLAKLWVKGLVINWEELYAEMKPRRLSLPLYPFETESYWISVPKHDEMKIVSRNAVEYLHPLVHRNTSMLDRVRYSTVLSGKEFFLKDHVVNDRQVVPGVIQLEWARAAVELALRGKSSGENRIRLEQVNWLRPLEVESELLVYVELREEAGDRIGYDIY
jgi:polyketide synthase PksN